MNETMRQVVNFLFGTGNLEEVDDTLLQELIDDSPYFPIGQFLKTRKLHNGGDAAFQAQAQKTALYFHNPLWLQKQLNGQEYNVDEVFRFDTHLQVEEIDYNWNEEHDIEASNEVPEAEISADYYGVAPRYIESIMERVVQDEDTPPTIAELTKGNDATTDEATVAEPVSSDNAHQITEASIDETPADEATGTLEEMAGASHEITPETAAFLDGLQVTDVPVVQEPPAIADSMPEANAKPVELESTQEQDNSEPDEHERMFQNIKAMLDASVTDAHSPVAPGAVPIDPYFTIDYFASQGIKLELDANPKDQLGQNLKKFTQWLKHMKKLGPEDAAETMSKTDTEAEAEVQRIADFSNNAREVVTEAMAQVLEKQGKRQKAIELYNKLSFLNPDKRAYFAAKIKSLKEP